METARKKLFAVGAVIEQYDSIGQTIQAERLKYEQLRRDAMLSDKVKPEHIRAAIDGMERQLALCSDILLYYTGAESVEEARDAYATLVTAYGYYNKCRDAVSLVACGADAAGELGLPEGTTPDEVAVKFGLARATVIATADAITLPPISHLQTH